MDTQAKRNYVKRFYREMVRDGYMTMEDTEITEIVDGLNAAELAHEVRSCKDVEET